MRRFAARLFEARCRDDPGMEGAAELLGLMRETLAAAPTPRHLGLIKIVRARRAAERWERADKDPAAVVWLFVVVVVLTLPFSLF